MRNKFCACEKMCNRAAETAIESIVQLFSLINVINLDPISLN